MLKSSPITCNHKQVVVSFIQMLRTTQVPNPDRCASIAQMLGEEFDVNLAEDCDSYDTEIDIVEVLAAALKEREEKQKTVEGKFQVFLQLLEKKGYFNGVSPATPEYEQRVQKAYEKFNKRNNPYDGLTAEQIKNKGNELMSQDKHKEAIACYTKSIELDAENAIYFANRAAAHIHLKDFSSAVIDCERAVVINPNYSKAYFRLGTALFYQENYSRAVDSFSKACELDPDNAIYKEELQRAEEKMQSSEVGVTQNDMSNGFSGFPGMGGGMPDMSQFANMMNNPQFMETAQRMMQNPEFRNLVGNMAGRFTQNGGLNAEAMQRMGAELVQNMGVPDVEGNVSTPFGKVNKAAFEELQQEEIRKNPELAAVMADVQANGYTAFQKYMDNPAVMELTMKFQNLFSGGQ